MASFLAITRPVEANVLVVEGWIGDDALAAAAREFIRGGYECLVTSGGPLSKGHFLSSYQTFGALSAAALRKLGCPEEKLIDAPSAKTARHRTFESARSVKRALEEKHIVVRGVNVITEATHARRTRTVYRRVLDGGVPVGVIAAAPTEFEIERWWRSSEGIKQVLTEGLGWFFEAALGSGYMSAH
jgi:uncharacterized SAM-binding protein YcdF (DUF218 family)